MSNLDTESSSPSLRDTVEASYASHTPSPDVDSIVNGAVEHDRATRHRDRAKPVDHYQHAGDSAARLRSQIRGSIHETSLKAAAGPPQPATKHESPIGPPASWDLKAKSQWAELPQEVRLATQRDHSQFKTGYDNHVMPHLERYAELDRVIAPSRAVFQQYGCKSDAEAVQRLFEWEHSLRVDPHQGIQRLAHQLGIDLRQLAGGSPQPDCSPQEEQAVHQHLEHFSRDKPHFETVRYTMGVLLATRGEKYMAANGNFDLDAAYLEACRLEGLSDNRARHTANVSPRGRSPAYAAPEHRGGSSVKKSILNSIRELRG